MILLLLNGFYCKPINSQFRDFGNSIKVKDSGFILGGELNLKRNEPTYVFLYGSLRFRGVITSVVFAYNWRTDDVFYYDVNMIDKKPRALSIFFSCRSKELLFSSKSLYDE